MHALVIVNPVAGAQRPLEVAELAAAHLRASAWTVRIEATERSGHATGLAAAHAAACDLVVVVGGDGTLRETVAGLRGRSVPVGFVPMGNANVMAREFDIPLRPEAAIAVLSSGEKVQFDVGCVGDTLFLAMVGVGYDGWVTGGVDAFRKTGWGQWLYRHGASSLLYVLAGIPALFRLRPNAVTVEADDAPLAGRYPSVVVSNAASYSIGWAMTPGANVHDGLLDHHANRRCAPWFVLWTTAASMLRRRVPRVVAEYGSARRYRIRSERPFRWQVDGDPMPPTTSIEIGLLPEPAVIIVPARDD